MGRLAPVKDELVSAAPTPPVTAGFVRYACLWMSRVPDGKLYQVVCDLARAFLGFTRANAHLECIGAQLFMAVRGNRKNNPLMPAAISLPRVRHGTALLARSGRSLARSLALLVSVVTRTALSSLLLAVIMCLAFSVVHIPATASSRSTCCCCCCCCYIWCRGRFLHGCGCW